MVSGHYVLLYKGDPQPTTRQPKALGARIRAGTSRKRLTVSVERHERAALRIALFNTAETRWLAGERPDGGWTRLGAHLYADADGALIDFDWLRVELPHDVGQHESVTVPVMLPPIAEPGLYRVVFDLVIEGQAWFVERGSVPEEVMVHVRAPETRSAPVDG
jgi:hypothetical protein